MSNHEREPIERTCPDINALIKEIRNSIRETKYSDRDDEDSLRDRLNAVHMNLSDAEDILEDLRKSNDELRAWGISEARARDELEKKLGL